MRSSARRARRPRRAASSIHSASSNAPSAVLRGDREEDRPITAMPSAPASCCDGVQHAEASRPRGRGRRQHEAEQRGQHAPMPMPRGAAGRERPGADAASPAPDDEQRPGDADGDDDEPDVQHGARSSGPARRADAGADGGPDRPRREVRPVWIVLKPSPSCRYSEIASMSPIIAEEHERDDDAHGDARVRTGSSPERGAPVRSRRALVPRRKPRRRRRWRRSTRTSSRPALLATLDERLDQQRAGAGRRAIAPATSEPRRVLRPRLGQQRAARRRTRRCRAGTLTRKIARQPRPKRSPSTSAAPMIGPSTPPRR